MWDRMLFPAVLTNIPNLKICLKGESFIVLLRIATFLQSVVVKSYMNYLLVHFTNTTTNYNRSTSTKANAHYSFLKFFIGLLIYTGS